MGSARRVFRSCKQVPWSILLVLGNSNIQDKEVADCRKALGRFSLKKQTNKQTKPPKLLNYQGLVLRKGKKFPRVKRPKLKKIQVRVRARAHDHKKACDHYLKGEFHHSRLLNSCFFYISEQV